MTLIFLSFMSDPLRSLEAPIAERAVFEREVVRGSAGTVSS
jgi:hypothetical protein